MRNFDHLSAMVKIRTLISLLYGVAIPLIFWFYTNSSIPLFLLLLVVVFVTSIHIIKALSSGFLTVFCGMFSSLITAIFGLSVLIGIVVTPFSVYDLWFDAMTEGSGTGTVSNLFTLLSAFFSTSLGATFVSIGYSWPLLIAGLYISTLLSIMLQVPTFYLLTFIICLACLIFLVFSGNNLTHLIRRTLYSVTLFFVVFLFAILLSGGRTATGSRVVDMQLHPKLRQYVSNNFPQFPLLYGIPGYGYSFQDRSLGGTPVLSPLPIFNISTNSDGPLYLKTDIFDLYDGKSWKTSLKRSGSLQELQTIMLHGNPGSASYSTLVDSSRKTGIIRVELLTDFYNKLPYTLATRRFHFEEEPPKIKNGNFHTGFRLAKPLISGNVFFIDQNQESVILNKTVLTKNQIEPLELSKIDRRRYLQLPLSINEDVRKIASKFRDPTMSLEQRLHNIVDYLSQTCIYSLNVGNLRRSENFLEKFLIEEKKGYCVHFATAFTILARLVGVPTRYNTGFLVNFPNEETETNVTGLAAHSWPEVWINGRGWTRWESTPILATLTNINFLDGEEYWANNRFEMETDDYTIRQVQSILGESEIDVLQIETTVNLFTANRTLTRHVVKFVIMAMIATLIIWRLSYYLKIRRQSRELQLPIILFKRYILIGRTLGVKNPNYTGWTAWGHSVKRNLGHRNLSRQRLIERFLKLVSHSVYGQQVISTRDISFLRKLFWWLLWCRLFRLNLRRHSDHNNFESMT